MTRTITMNDYTYDMAVGLLARCALRNEVSPREVTESIKSDVYDAMMEIENETLKQDQP